MDTDSISKEEEIPSTEASQIPSSGEKVDDISNLTETQIQRSDEHSNEKNNSNIESSFPDEAGEVAQSTDTKIDVEIDSYENTYQENDSEEINLEENSESGTGFSKTEIQNDKPVDESNPQQEDETEIYAESNDKENLDSLTTSGNENPQISIINEITISEPISDVIESQTFNTYQEETEKCKYVTHSAPKELDSVNATLEENLETDSSTSEANIQTKKLTENICAKEEKTVNESNKEINIEKITVSELTSVAEENQEESVCVESSTNGNETKNNESENKNIGREIIPANEAEEQIIREENSELELTSTNNELSCCEDVRERVDLIAPNVSSEFKNENDNASESDLALLATDLRERVDVTAPDVNSEFKNEIDNARESDFALLATDLRIEENSETESTSFDSEFPNENTIKNLEKEGNSEFGVTSDYAESVSDKFIECKSEKDSETTENFSVIHESKITDAQEIYETEITGNDTHKEEISSGENIKEEEVNKPLDDSQKENNNENILSSNKEHQEVEQKDEELQPDNETFADTDLEVEKITEQITKDKPEHDNSKSQNTDSNHENKSNLCDADSKINKCCNNNQGKNKISKTESTHLQTEVYDNTLEEKVNEVENSKNEFSVSDTEHTEKLEDNVPEGIKQECDSWFAQEENPSNEPDKEQIKLDTCSDVISNISQDNTFNENINKDEKHNPKENSDITDSQDNIFSEEKVKEQRLESESTCNEIQTNNDAESCLKEDKPDPEQIPDKPISINNDLHGNKVINETLNPSLVVSQSNVEDLSSKTSAEEQTSSDTDLWETSTHIEHWKDTNYNETEHQNNELTENLKNKEKTESEMKSKISEFQENKNNENFFKNETNEIESISETSEPQLNKITQQLINNTNSDEIMIDEETDHQLNINRDGTEREH